MTATGRLPRVLLHAEGAVVATAAVAVYFHAGYPWWLLVALALAPDLIWIVHIGVDRTLGYGLKYPTDFKDTHLQRV